MMPVSRSCCFPSPGFSPENPISHTQMMRLPGTKAGQQFFWEVTSAGGQEHFFLYVTPQRLVEFEQLLASLPRAELGRTVEQPAPVDFGGRSAARRGRSQRREFCSAFDREASLPNCRSCPIRTSRPSASGPGESASRIPRNSKPRQRRCVSVFDSRCRSVIYSRG